MSEAALKAGDVVTVRCNSKSMRAMVMLASENGHSLMLAFDGLFHGYVAMMPVLWVGECYRDLVTDTAMEVTRRD